MSFKGPSRRLWGLPVLALLVAACSGRPLAAAPLEISPAARAGQNLLHQGRFKEASVAFGRVADRSPADPEGPLLEALTTWWMLLDSPKDKDLLVRLQAQLDEATRRGEALLGGADAQRGRILAGTAQMLAAQAHVAQKDYFAAGSAARKGNKFLEEALSADADAADAGFALGAYKYFAARLSWIVRLLRFVIFLPGGSESEGLAALEQAAQGSKLFAVESNLLLAYIYSGEDQNDFRKGLTYLQAASAQSPDSPLFAVVESRFLFSLGRLSEAEAAARRALDLCARLPGVATEVADLARLRLALALYYQYRPEDARAALAPLLQPASGEMPEDSISTLSALRGRLEWDLVKVEGGSLRRSETPSADPAEKMVAAAPLPPGQAGAAALKRLREGDAAEAAAALEKIVASDPNDMISRYHLARAYMAAGDSGRAAEELHLVLQPGTRIPRTIRGWALVRLGDACEASGRREEARGYYKAAAELKGFVFKRAASDRMKYPEHPRSEG